MSYTLGNLIPDALKDIAKLRIGRATGGSTTTIVQNSRPSNGVRDDKYAGGCAFVLKTTDDAAPVSQFARITSYVSGTGTFTLTDALTAAVGNGDRYGVSTNEIVLDEYIELASDALQMFDLPFLDESLTSAASQTEYALPVALKKDDLLRLRYQGITTDANDNRWIDIDDWDIEPAAAGSTGTLIIPQLPSGYTIQLWYVGKHPAVNAYSDVINERIDPQLARAALVERLRNKEVERTLGAARPQRSVYDKAAAKLDEMKQKFPIYLPSKRSKLMGTW